MGGGSLRFRRSLFAAVSALSLVLLASSAQAVVNKPFTPPVSTAPAAGTKVDVDADVITYDPRTKIGTARGTVKLVYGPYTLTASHVTINEATGEFTADGSIMVREPNGNVLLADSADLRNHFRDGLMSHIKALLNNDVTITADILKRVDGTTYIYEKATYTACKDCKTRSGHPVWEIDSDETTHDTKTHDLYHVNPRLKINGATVATLPYMSMPDPSVTRRSGFLMPDFKTGGDYGLGLVTPYFWAITPSTDLTFRPMWTTYQGPVADVEWRQAFENGGYSLRGMGVHQFHDLPAPENGAWRGAVETNGRFSNGEDWTYGWDGTFATDRTFLNSYYGDGRNIATNDAFATGVWDQTYISAQMLNFGSLSTGVNADTLPYAMPFITGEVINRDMALGGQLDFSWNAYSLHRATSVTPFTTVNQGTDQTRATTQMNWHRQFYSDAGTVVTPFANMRGDILITDNVPDPTAPGGFTSTTASRVLPEAGLDARYPFVANLPFGQSIVSPVFQIVASANEGDTSAFGNEDSITLNYDHTSLFLADRFTGLDRYEGGTHADVGVTYSLIGNNGGFIRASAGQSFHLAGQNSFVNGSGLADNESDLVGAIVFQPWNELSLSYETRVKDDFSAINRQEAVASLSFDRFAANLSYLDFAAEPAYGLTTRQHWVSADTKIGLSGGWSMFGGLTYDFTASVLTQKTFGFEYDCQCMNFKLAYTGTEDSISHAVENKVMMSVEFATLGKTGFAANF
ncbi:MAG: LPS-assembly protein LptD [Alphaproteobacteria bacterium]|nr:LPS-assembly protein LptD [Alphaproteobacteria bacterium]